MFYQNNCDPPLRPLNECERFTWPLVRPSNSFGVKDPSIYIFWPGSDSHLIPLLFGEGNGGLWNVVYCSLYQHGILFPFSYLFLGKTLRPLVPNDFWPPLRFCNSLCETLGFGVRPGSIIVGLWSPIGDCFSYMKLKIQWYIFLIEFYLVCGSTFSTSRFWRSSFAFIEDLSYSSVCSIFLSFIRGFSTSNRN